MTNILFGTGEDEIITVVSGSVTTDATTFRSTHARCSLSAGLLQHRFAGKLKDYLDAQPANDKDFWYGFRFRGGGGFITGLDMVYFYDEAGKAFMRITGNSSASGMLLWTAPDGSTWTQYPASSTTQPSTPT